MTDSITDYHAELMSDIVNSAGANGDYHADAFFSIICDELVDLGEISTADRAYLSVRGIQIDGYGGDPTDSGFLHLIISDYKSGSVPKSLTKSALDTILKRAVNFIRKSLDRKWRESLPESNSGAELSQLIAVKWDQVLKIKIILISNRSLSDRVSGQKQTEVDGRSVSFVIWDLNRLQKLKAAGLEREPIEIDLMRDFNTGIKALEVSDSGGDYQAYLGVLPGRLLAEIFDLYGTRLLEQNVRVFLQARGNVNKGIRNTIDNEPHNFFAYNNGITATAESVELDEINGELLITSIRNLQIVNGGQTTCSIHAAYRKNSDSSCVDKVAVQMKLAVIPPDDIPIMVPKVSRFANSQNKVSEADFFSNHPYHHRIEEFSRRLLVPASDGSVRNTKWFYERARGQYQDERGKRTPGDKRKFETEYPKNQMFTKTDAAKFEMVWRCQPHVVSSGAQKNFRNFSEVISREWESSDKNFNEMYFEHLVAKGILFRHTEKVVSAAPWYEGGYRANIVSYTLSRIAHEARSDKLAIDFSKIWNGQCVPATLAKTIATVAETIAEFLTNPPPNRRNVSEWSKIEDCWKQASQLDVDWPCDISMFCESGAAHADRKRDSRKDQKVLSGAMAQIQATEIPKVQWAELHTWIAPRKILKPMELGIIDVASDETKILSEKQALIAIESMDKARDAGWKPATLQST